MIIAREKGILTRIYLLSVREVSLGFTGMRNSCMPRRSYSAHSGPCPPDAEARRPMPTPLLTVGWTSRFADGPYLRDESSIRIVITVRK